MMDFDGYEAVSPWRVGQIARGSTSADWVLSSFGEPGRITRHEDGTEVWRYSKASTVQTDVDLFLLLLLHLDMTGRQDEQLFVEIRNARVNDYWLQSAS